VRFSASLLSEEERERAARFRLSRSRDRYVVAHGTLRLILADYVKDRPEAIAFHHHPGGKPELAEGSTVIRFNLSHSADLAAVVIASDREVGVDVERQVTHLEELRLAASLFSPREVSALESIPPGDRRAAFFRCWTRKEAYVKARDNGVSISLNDFAVSVASGQPPHLLWSRDGSHEAWSLHDLQLPGPFFGAVAVQGHDARIVPLEAAQWSSN